MRFAKIIFYTAFAWGLIVLTPLYFIFDLIGRQDPPPITHPGFYYGFVGCGLAWQFAFFVIARDPVRLRSMMLPSVLEKFSFAAAIAALYVQQRVRGADLFLAGIDFTFGLLFLAAFFRTRAVSSPQGSKVDASAV